MNKQFIPGQTYSTRSICDYNCIFEITVASRTACTIKTTEGKTLRIAKWETAYSKAETVFPMGRYSMAPAISAK